MDNKKILLVNLSKGKMGELNSKLIGMIFVMKFQAAAMGRANVPEDQRVDFTLYVDEFQNFATDSFESILSEARKYRLNLVLANQFMTQLTDKIREAIIGNIGTVISGRIGITDAEILQKKYQPTFDAEDLTKLPNFQSIASVMINNVPSAAFSMSFVPPMGTSNPQLVDAIKKLSAAKYGRPRAEVEAEIFKRLGAGDEARKVKMDALKQAQQERLAALQARGAGPTPAGAPSSSVTPSAPAAANGSFLDDWLAKRQQLSKGQPSPASTTPRPPATPVQAPQTPSIASPQPVSKPEPPQEVSKPEPTPMPQAEPVAPPQQPSDEGHLHIREGANHNDGVSLKLR